MRFIDKTKIERKLDYPRLIKALPPVFAEKINAPPRHYHDFKNFEVGVIALKDLTANLFKKMD